MIPCQALRADGTACTAVATQMMGDGRSLCLSHYRAAVKKKAEKVKHIPIEMAKEPPAPKPISPQPMPDARKERKKRTDPKQLRRGSRQCDYINKEGTRCKGVVMGRLDNGRFVCRHHHEQAKHNPEEMENALLQKKCEKAITKRRPEFEAKINSQVADKGELLHNRYNKSQVLTDEQFDRVTQDISRTSRVSVKTHTGKVQSLIPLISDEEFMKQYDIPLDPMGQLERAIWDAWKHTYWMDAWLRIWQEEEDMINTVTQTGEIIGDDGEPRPVEMIIKRHATFKELAIRLFDQKTKAMSSLHKLLIHRSTMLYSMIMGLQNMGFTFDMNAAKVAYNMVEEEQRKQQLGGTYYRFQPTPPENMVQTRPFGDDWGRASQEIIEATPKVHEQMEKEYLDANPDRTD